MNWLIQRKTGRYCGLQEHNCSQEGSINTEKEVVRDDRTDREIIIEHKQRRSRTKRCSMGTQMSNT